MSEAKNEKQGAGSSRDLQTDECPATLALSDSKDKPSKHSDLASNLANEVPTRRPPDKHDEENHHNNVVRLPSALRRSDRRVSDKTVMFQPWWQMGDENTGKETLILLRTRALHRIYHDSVKRSKAWLEQQREILDAGMMRMRRL